MKSKDLHTYSEKTVEQLKASNELKTKWLSLIAHDFKGLFSNVQLLLNALTSESITPDMFASMLPELQQIADKNSKTLASTFAWVRAQTDEFTIHAEPVVINQLYAELLEEFNKVIDAKKLTFNFVGDKNTTLHTDRFLLRFILKQLLENAIKYSNQGGAVTLMVKSHSDVVSITIKDEGMGMNSSRLAAIGTLDAAPYTGTMNEKGAGLSLVIVKDFVEMLHGTMHVSSVEGEGTGVELRIKGE